MRSCPSDRFLQMLSDDDLGSVIFDAIEKHIAECPDCRAWLEPLASECPEPTTSPIEILPQAGDLPSIRGFSLEKEIARGAMGVVYLGGKEAVGRQVAGCKVIHAVPGADQPSRNRWRKEAKAFSSVRHPNVVLLHDVGEDRSWLYLVLEYIPGRTLKDRLEGPLRPRGSRPVDGDDRGGRASHSPGRAPPPRPQAVQHPDRLRARHAPGPRDPQGRRFWHRSLPRRLRAYRHGHHARRILGRHAFVHGPGAGRRDARSTRPGGRRPRTRGDPLPTRYRCPSVPRRDRDRRR